MSQKRLTFEILMSCMNQKDLSLVKQSNVHSNVLLVNQCDKDATEELFREGQCIKMISSTERGLSRSRNMALRNTNADIILLADDDEVFEDNVENIILQGFETTNADIMAFDLSNYPKKIKKKAHRLNRLELLRVASCQIACRTKALKEAKLEFDVNLGAGTPNGGGEESKLLWDAHKLGLKIYYCPVCIASLREKESTWFDGFDKEYFYKRGRVTSYYMGDTFAFVYALYFLFVKHRMYKKDCCFREAFGSLMKGIRSEKDFSNI